jgi:predicted nucleic acid-binding protein
MTPLFIDTSYLLALELKNDQNHEAAVDHWRRLSASPPPLITTSYVFDEVVTFFNSRGYHRKATQVGYTLPYSPSVRIVHVEKAMFHAAWAYFLQHPDKTYSFTDCTPFVVLRSFEITTALAFDKHFIQAGFRTEP